MDTEVRAWGFSYYCYYEATVRLYKQHLGIPPVLISAWTEHIVVNSTINATLQNKLSLASCCI